MVVKFIDPCATGGDFNPDPTPAPKETITVKIDTSEAMSQLEKGIKFMQMYGSGPAKLIPAEEDIPPHQATVPLKTFGVGKKGPYITGKKTYEAVHEYGVAPQNVPKKLNVTEVSPLGFVGQPANHKPFVGMDMASLETKLAGGGVHPTFEMEKDIAKQEFLMAMKVPNHMISTAIPYQEAQSAIDQGMMEPLAAQIAHDMLGELQQKIVGYLMATFGPND